MMRCRPPRGLQALRACHGGHESRGPRYGRITESGISQASRSLSRQSPLRGDNPDLAAYVCAIVRNRLARRGRARTQPVRGRGLQLQERDRLRRRVQTGRDLGLRLRAEGRRRDLRGRDHIRRASIPVQDQDLLHRPKEGRRRDLRGRDHIRRASTLDRPDHPDHRDRLGHRDRPAHLDHSSQPPFTSWLLTIFHWKFRASPRSMS
jgi:hypothetical protein